MKMLCLTEKNHICTTAAYCDKQGCLMKWDKDRKASWERCSVCTIQCTGNECKQGCKYKEGVSNED